MPYISEPITQYSSIPASTVLHTPGSVEVRSIAHAAPTYEYVRSAPVVAHAPAVELVRSAYTPTVYSAPHVYSPTVYAAPSVRYAAPAVEYVRHAAPVVETVEVRSAPAVATVIPHEAKYTAANLGAVHEAPLPGHALSQTSLNLAPAA